MLILTLNYPDYEEGSYGTVFFSSDGRATKVFHRKNDIPEAHVEQVFKSEVEAYELASVRQDLCNLIPTYFGCVSVQKIINSADEDISNKFYLDRAYQMQWIRGTFIKLSTLTPDIKQAVEKDFFSAGIYHTCDASVVFKENRVTCIIDFATQEYLLEHEPISELDLPR